MNAWQLAALVPLAGLVPCGLVALWATPASGLVALELAGVLSATALMLLSEGFGRQPFIDLAVALAALSLVGSLVFARMMERHL